MTTACADELVVARAGKALEQSAERYVSRPSTRRGDDERVVKMAHAGRSVVLHGEIAEQSQAVSRQQKTRYSRCRQSTHTVKQCAVINCVVLCCLGFHSPLSMRAKLSSYQALPDIIVNIRTLAAHYSFNTKTQMTNSCVVN